MYSKKNFYLIFISFLLIVAFSITILNTIDFFNEKSGAQFSDWLINYQSGFIRRGLIGELVYQLHIITNISLLFFLYSLVFLLYLIFFFTFYLIIKKINLQFIDTLIILSPLSFIYTVMEQKVSGRKDIVYLALISIFILNIKKINFSNQKYFLIIALTITTLTHSGFIFYSFFYILLFVLINLEYTKKEILLQLIPVFISLIFIVILLTFFSYSSIESVTIICNSIKDYLPNCGTNDYIETLNWTIQENSRIAKVLWIKTGYYNFYLLAFLISFFPFLTKVFYSSIKNYNINLLSIFIFSLISTLPIYFIGVDYGRYMFLAYVSLVLIYYHLLSLKIIHTNLDPLKFIEKSRYANFLRIIFLLLYSFTFTVPHCCANQFKFLYGNVVDKFKKID